MSERIVTACVLVIGNEILSGRTQDTNLNHITRQLNDWGIRVREARVIPDVEETIVDAVRDASTRFDYVFTTGGIGPTHDDITADCIASAFEVGLVEHPEIAAIIRQREAPPDVMVSRLRMARVPEGARLIDNSTGGPQGFAIGNVYVMAGIPWVMQAMLSTLEGKLEGGAPVRSRSVTAFLELELAEGIDPGISVDELVTVLVRYKEPDGDVSTEISRPFAVSEVQPDFSTTSNAFQLAASVAEYAEILRRSDHSEGAQFGAVREIAAAAVDTRSPDQVEFLVLVDTAQRLFVE